MTKHITGTREQWLTARLELLKEEKALTRRSDELARRRQELPWVPIDKEYRFETTRERLTGRPLPRTLATARLSLHVRADYKAGCPSCSAIADGFERIVVHLANHDVALSAVSRAPLAKLQAYKQRMGGRFPGRLRLAGTSTSTSTSRSRRNNSARGPLNYNYRREAASQLRGGEGPRYPRAKPPTDPPRARR